MSATQTEAWKNLEIEP